MPTTNDIEGLSLDFGEGPVFNPTALSYPVPQTGLNRPPGQVGDISPPRTNYELRNERDNIPLDIYGGLGLPVQTAMSFLRTDKDKQNYLVQQFGKEAVRLSDVGDLIVRLPDAKTGQLKDVVAEPYGLTMPKLATETAAALPELAGWIAGASVAPPAALIRGLMYGALGAAAGGTAKDVAARLAYNRPIQPGEIVAHQAMLGLGGIAAGTALGAPVKLLSGYARVPAHTLEARQAQKLIKRTLGIDFELSPAQTTGSKTMAKVEAFMEQMPGSSLPLTAIKERQEAAIRATQSAMTGGGVLPEAGTVGTKAMDIMRAEAAGLKGGVQSAQAATDIAASKAVNDTLASIAGSGPIDRVAAGDAIYQAAEAARNAWKATTGYPEFFGQPWTRSDSIPMASMSQMANKLLKSISATELKEVQTGLVDKFGRPILKTTTRQITPRSMVPSATYSRLKWIADHPDAQVSLNTLKTWRSEIDDDILRNSPVPGTKNYILNQLRKSLTDTMTKGVETASKSLNQPELVNLWKTINENYAINADKFTKPGIAELFREDTRALGNISLVQRAVSNPDIYLAYRDFFGKNSPQFQAVKRAVLDDLVGRPDLQPGGLIDITGFVNRYKAMADPRGGIPEVLADILGAEGKQVGSLVKFLSQMKISGNVDPDALLSLIRNQIKIEGTTGQAVQRSQLMTKLNDLVNQSKIESLAYRNRIRNWISTDSLTPDKIRSDEFVTRMAEAATPNEINEILSLIQRSDPGLVEQIRIRAIADIFNRSASTSTPGEPLSSVLSAMRLPTGKGLRDIIGSEQQRKAYIAMIGEDPMAKLQAISSLLYPREVIQGTFRTAGQIASGTVVANLERLALWAVAKTVGKSVLVGNIYVRLPKGWLRGEAISPYTRARLLKAAVNSPGVIRFINDTYSGRQAENTLAGLNQVLDNLTRATGGQYNINPETKQALDIINSIEFTQDSTPQLQRTPNISTNQTNRFLWDSNVNQLVPSAP